MDGEVRSKRRKTVDYSVDFLSNLPTELIDDIVQHLPTQDVARMSVLSRKWHEIWLSIPRLILDAPFFSHCIRSKKDATHQFYSIVSRILYQHRGPIFEFHLYVPPWIDYPDVTRWISFLSRNGIRDFTLRNDHECYLWLSTHIFSCTGLETLKLESCELGVGLSFSTLTKLVRLKLVDVIGQIGALEHLIASCPLLEELNLTDCKDVGDAIEAPRLKHLVCVGQLLRVRNSKNLLSASFDLGVSFAKQREHKVILRDLIGIFANSAKLEKLSFGNYFYRLLFEECKIRRTFKSIKILELPKIYLNDSECFDYVIRAIQACHDIERFYITVYSSKDWKVQMLDNITLHHLRWAKVAVGEALNVELKLIEFLLACSPKLETLLVSFIQPVKKSLKVKLLGQLNRLRRASPIVAVIGPDGSESSSDPDSCSESSQMSSFSDEFSEPIDLISYSSSSGFD